MHPPQIFNFTGEYENSKKVFGLSIPNDIQAPGRPFLDLGGGHISQERAPTYPGNGGIRNGVRDVVQTGAGPVEMLSDEEYDEVYERFMENLRSFEDVELKAYDGPEERIKYEVEFADSSSEGSEFSADEKGVGTLGKIGAIITVLGAVAAGAAYYASGPGPENQQQDRIQPLLGAGLSEQVATSFDESFADQGYRWPLFEKNKPYKKDEVKFAEMWAKKPDLAKELLGSENLSRSDPDWLKAVANAVNGDEDKDGLMNYTEVIEGWNPLRKDTSGDGIGDEKAAELDLDPTKGYPFVSYLSDRDISAEKIKDLGLLKDTKKNQDFANFFFSTPKELRENLCRDYLENGLSGGNSLLFELWDEFPTYRNQITQKFLDDGVSEWEVQQLEYLINVSKEVLEKRLKDGEAYMEKNGDIDGDILTNEEELKRGTDPFIPFGGKNVKFTNLPSQEQEQLVEYHGVQVADRAAEIIGELTERNIDRLQVIKYSEENPLVAHSGYPIVVGSYGWKNSEEPIWFPFFHEMGHNFNTIHEFNTNNTLWSFSNVVSEDRKMWAWNESFASLDALYTLEEFHKNPGKYREKFGNKTYQSLMEKRKSLREEYLTELKKFEKGGNDYSIILEKVDPSADIIDGMLIEIGEKYGWDTYEDMFNNFKSLDKNKELIKSISPIPDNMRATEKRTGILMAALNYGSEENILPYFEEHNVLYNKSTYKNTLDWLASE